MKIRNGFVSNSSSSSFVVATSVLTAEEVSKIFAYPQYAEENQKEQAVIPGSTIRKGGTW